MMKKRLMEIYHPGIISVHPGDTAQEAISIMRDRNVSCVVVVDGETPVGIFTERDLVRCVAEYSVGFRDRPISEIMTRGVLGSRADAFLYEAFHLLAERGIRHLAVLDEAGKVVGMVTQSDLIKHLGYDYFVKVKTVSQIMQKTVASILPEATALEATKAMARRSMSFLVAMSQQSPEGVITERDVTRLVAEGRDLAQVRVREVMSAPVVALRHDAPAYEAAELMRNKGIRRLVVVDEFGAAVGVTTQTDMVRGLESKYVETLKRIIVDQGSELNRAIRELTEKTLYLDTILSSSIDMGIVATDAAGRVLYFNAGAERTLDCRAEDAVGKSLAFIHDREGVPMERLDKAMAVVRKGGVHAFSFERKTRGEILTLHARLSGIRAKDSLVGYVLLLLDVTEQRKAEETIRHLAYYDVLTDLPNRALFAERLALELAHAKRHQEPLALMVADLDRFKEINDTLGHPVGDQVLKGTAQRLRAALRESDTVARMGGDEFALVIPNVAGREAAEAVARKVLAEFAAPLVVDGRDIQVNLSLGVALYPEHGADIEELLRRADAAMYQAKERGHQELRSTSCISEGL
jgi:diguanylate cyclase (GGDEF)-like protein/PAS domain S-box-containing protein